MIDDLAKELSTIMRSYHVLRAEKPRPSDFQEQRLELREKGRDIGRRAFDRGGIEAMEAICITDQVDWDRDVWIIDYWWHRIGGWTA